MAAGAVEREHELPAQPLTPGMLGAERLELADQVRGAPGRDVGVDPSGREPVILEAGDLRGRERLASHVREGGAAPDRERAPQRLVRRHGVVPRELCLPSPQQLLEAVGVELALLEPERVAAGLGDEHVVSQRLAQARRDDLDGVLGVRRRLARPQLVHDAVDRDDRAAVAAAAAPVARAAVRAGRRQAGREAPATSTGPRIRNSMRHGDSGVKAT